MALRTLRPRVLPTSTYSVTPPPKQADPHYQSVEHRVWAADVILRAGGRCQWVDEYGQRCATCLPARLVADHIIERKDNGADLDPSNGQALCIRHNTLKAVLARRHRR